MSFDKTANSIRPYRGASDSTNTMANPDTTMKSEFGDKYEQERPSSDNGSSMTENQTCNVDDEKPSKAAQPPPSKPFTAQWDGPDDPDNPQNWSKSKKWSVTFFAAMVTFVSVFASSLFSSAVETTAKRFHVSTEVTTLETSLFVAGFAAGPLMFGPLSEQFGRKRPLLTGTLVLTLFHIPVALAPDIGVLLFGRFMSGIGGSAPLAIIGGLLADFWDPVGRGVAICGFAAATFAGPILGPIVGSFMIVSGVSWRWLGYLVIIYAGIIFVIGSLVLSETHAPTILRHRAVKRAQDPEEERRIKKELKPGNDLRTIFVIYLMRPFVMMVQEPILLLLTIYMAFLYGLVYLAFSAWPISFRGQRHWSEGVAALPFLSITVGVLIGCVVTIYLTRTHFARKMKENNGVVVPEERLVPALIGAPLIPISFFWWAWTSNPHVIWVPQVMAGAPFGMGILMIFLPSLNYLIDVYRMYANSAISGNAVARSLVAAGFPLFATPMYNKLGVPWATSLLGFIALALTPIPFLFYIYGAKIRQWSKYSPTNAANSGVAR